jgi:uncharacterized membrane protein
MWQLAGVLLVVFIFIVGCVAIAQYLDRAETDPEKLLRARFAKGEISESEYLRNLAILQHGTKLLLEQERSPGETGPSDT